MFELPTEAEPVRVIEGDCLSVLRGLPAGSVDAVVTDPPYPCIKRSYGYWTEAEWFALMNPVVEECRRVLKPTGSAVFVLQPNSERVGRMRTWLWEFMAKWGRDWGMVQDAWWWNPAALPMPGADAEKVRRPLRPSLKACVWFGAPDSYRDESANRWEESDSNRALRLVSRARIDRRPSGLDVRQDTVTGAAVRNGGTTPFNVLPIPNTNSTNSAGSHGHGAGTPLALCRWWVRYICPPGGVVLDPFLGSGTVALAALAEGRRAVGIEKEPAYAAVARKRVAEAMGGGLFAALDTNERQP